MLCYNCVILTMIVGLEAIPNDPVDEIFVDTINERIIPCGPQTLIIPAHPHERIEWGFKDQSLRLFVDKKVCKARSLRSRHSNQILLIHLRFQSLCKSLRLFRSPVQHSVIHTRYSQEVPIISSSSGVLSAPLLHRLVSTMGRVLNLVI